MWCAGSTYIGACTHGTYMLVRTAWGCVHMHVCVQGHAHRACVSVCLCAHKHVHMWAMWAQICGSTHAHICSCTHMVGAHTRAVRVHGLGTHR